MTTEAKTRTITLTNQPPVRIREEEWPAIAGGSFNWFDNQYEFQANRKCDIFVRVRQHADGRTLVYAGYDYSSAYQNERNAKYRTGELLASGEAMIPALHRVMDELAERAGEREKEIRDCLNECIADLPAQDL